VNLYYSVGQHAWSLSLEQSPLGSPITSQNPLYIIPSITQICVIQPSRGRGKRCYISKFL